MKSRLQRFANHLPRKVLKMAQKSSGEEEEIKTEPGGTRIFKRQENNTEEDRQERNQECVLEKVQVYKGGDQ